MKTKYLILFSFLFSGLLISGCTKNFERTNPHDYYSPSFKPVIVTGTSLVNDISNVVTGLNTTNGIINAGEHISMKLNLKNPTPKQLTYVDFVFSSLSGHARIAQSLYLGSLEASENFEENVEIDVLPGAKDGERLLFIVQMEAENQAQLSDTFSVVVKRFVPAYNLLLQSKLYYNAYSDGKIHSNGLLKYYINLFNNGTVVPGVNNIHCNMTYDANQVQMKVNDVPPVFDNILVGQKSTTYDLEIKMNNVAVGTKVTINFDISDIFGNTWPQKLVIPIEL